MHEGKELSHGLDIFSTVMNIFRQLAVIKSHDTQTWLPFEFVGGHATAAAAAEPQTMGAAAGCRVS
jgi:hypothetical protein